MEILNSNVIEQARQSLALRLEVQEAWEALTDKQRVALGLWLAGYTQREIAEMLGINARAIRYRIQFARKIFEEFCE